MKARLDLIGIVVEDMARSLAFYRKLGLDIPPDADGEPHVETTLPGGLRLAWDTVETVRSFDPEWAAPSGSPRVGLAFLFESPDEVDTAYETLGGRGVRGPQGALGRVLGAAVCRDARSGWELGRPVCAA